MPVRFPEPTFTFMVQIVNLAEVLPEADPSQLENILYQLRWATIQIPGVQGNLRHGDVFTVHGELAKQIKATYATGASALLSVVDNPAKPVADFSASATNGDAPLVVQFTDLSTNSPTEWFWNFDGDGRFESNSQHPIHTFADPGSYRISLIASNAGGVSTAIKEGYIAVYAQSEVAGVVVGGMGTETCRYALLVTNGGIAGGVAGHIAVYSTQTNGGTVCSGIATVEVTDSEEVVLSFDASTSDSGEGVSAVVPTPDAEQAFAFNSVSPRVGLPLDMEISVDGVLSIVVTFPDDYLGSTFTYTHTDSRQFNSTFRVGAIEFGDISGSGGATAGSSAIAQAIYETIPAGGLIAAGVADESVSGGSDLLTSLISHWKMDEASGNALDAHGTNDLTDVNGVVSSTGKINGCRRTTSALSEYLERTDNESLSFADDPFTINFWGAVPNKFEDSTEIFVAKGDLGDPAFSEYAIYWVQSTDHFYFLVSNGTAFTIVEATNFGNPVQGTLYMITAWHDPVVNEIGIAINSGTPDTTSISGGIQNSSQPFRIGSDSSGFRYRRIDIDELSIWDRVLSSDERTSLYNSGNALSYDNF